MLVASLLVTALLQAAPPVRVPGDTASSDTVSTAGTAVGATSAPADSTTALAWYRRAPSGDARLMPDWNRSLTMDTVPRRRRAVEYSDQYYMRLQIHRWGSWLEFPVFGAEYWLGQKLISPDQAPADWVKPMHGAVAGTLGGLFAINTVTGVWNLYESRNDTDQRALVWTHSVLMLAADAGFAVTSMLAGDAEESFRSRDRHRNAALVSMGIASAGTVIMWLKRGF